MVPNQWSRTLMVCAGAVLTIALTACSVFDRDGTDSTPDKAAAATALPGAGAANRVSLVQKLGQDGPLRSLNVEPDGHWECDDCAGDGVTSTGSLDPEQVKRLHDLLADPRLRQETDEARRYRVSCIDALTSSLLTSAGLITSQDCPGEDQPPVANEILLLLTQATPAEPTA
ncbi:hypothetical protein [Micromonospora purpureochromogenes]|uniref:Secreted protein n=1 Tax=Micromonospora purpureochromogenes TaxID=47872 RepID=A0ABX2RGF3_9ACTN|nr:hypothetical protein [Micromonospora purpureochromogenes]NYF55575.1 hypothetical protein [Micromonospora purpureochromogenes]